MRIMFTIDEQAHQLEIFAWHVPLPVALHVIIDVGKGCLFVITPLLSLSLSLFSLSLSLSLSLLVLYPSLSLFHTHKHRHIY